MSSVPINLTSTALANITCTVSTNTLSAHVTSTIPIHYEDKKSDGLVYFGHVFISNHITIYDCHYLLSLCKTYIKIKNIDAVAIQKRKKNNDNKTVDDIKMLRFSKTKVEKEERYCTKKQIKFWDIDTRNIDIKKLAETKNSSKYLF